MKEIGTIWTLHPDLIGDNKDIVVIVSGKKLYEDTVFYRVQPISIELDMLSENDVYIVDQSILGYPFFIEAWNEQPIHEKLFFERIGFIEPQTLTSIIPKKISLSPAQKKYRKSEIDRTSYLRDSVYVELDGLFVEQKNTKVIPLWGKVTLLKIAASFLLFGVVMAYTSVKLGWIEFAKKEENNFKDIQENLIVPETEEKSIELFSPRQTVVFYSGYDSEVEGGMGTTFRLFSNSLVDRYRTVIQDTVYMDIIEVLNPIGIANLFENSKIEPEKVVKAFYISPFYEKGMILFSDFSPPQLLYSDTAKFQIYYGGPFDDSVDWELIEDSPIGFIEKPTRMMEEYEKFVESSKFLDSIRLYFVIDKDTFKPISGQGMVYTKDFVENRQRYIENYIRNKDFKSNAARAEAQWQLYREQRTIEVKALPNPKEVRFQLLKPGWYALVR